MLLIIWIICGIIGVVLAKFSLYLGFGKTEITFGSILFGIIGIAFGPLAIFAGLIWLCCWAFEGPAFLDKDGCSWPIWWGRLRYKQHKAWKFIWYLGKPSGKSDWWSGWNNPPREYL